jgi:SHS2 domain-containing protein
LAGFTLLEHTADVGVVATGQTLGEALAWVAKGMLSLIYDLDTVAPRDCLPVSVVSRDREALVVDWLNELLYQYEAAGFLTRECQVSLEAGIERGRNQGDTRLEARCWGETLDPARHRILTVVKAATYHQLEVASASGGPQAGQWRIQVILDV